MISRDRKKGDDMFADSASTAGPGAGTGSTYVDPDTVYVSALYDAMNRLAEVTMYKVKHLPRILMQVFCILMPHFDQLTKLTIRKCGINVYTIHELNKLLHLTNLSDICLDESPLPEGNYAILLDNANGVRNLSLCRCKINDEVCKQISSKLHYLQPAEKQLLLLNLSSNHITDVGARYLGEALRTNRNLRYLNLADNRIKDEGAAYILNSLMEFPLTYDETMTKRSRYMMYLRARMDLFLKYMHECEMQSSDIDISAHSRKGKKRRNSNTSSASAKSKPASTKTNMAGQFLRTKAEMMAGERMGPYYDPFAPSSVKTRNEWPCCTGNMVLCYLNLAYNDLAFPSLKKINDVLVYQGMNKKLNETGLLKVVLDGNYMPQNCTELIAIGSLMLKSVARFGGRPEFLNRRKSRATITTVSEFPIPKRSAKS